MKIAFVYDVIYPYVKGGVEKRVRELATRLAARGHDVHVIGMKYWDGPDTVVQDGVTLHGICPPQPLYTDGRRTVREALLFSICLIPVLVREKFDIIDCQQFPYFPCFPVKLASMIKRTPLIITWHEVWGDYWYEYLGKAGFFGKLTERIVAMLSQDVVCVSKTTAEKFRGLTGRIEIPVIPNGIDSGHIGSISPSAGSFDFIYAGRLIREKHVDMLVRALAILSLKNPGLTLLIVGSGPECTAILGLIRDLGVENRVTVREFADTHDQVIGMMKAARVFVIPSTREGFGIAALEALACGLPVVTVDHPGNAIRELIMEKTGLVTTLSPDDLAETMLAALEHSFEMSAGCQAFAAEYDWDRIINQVETYYRSRVRS